MSKTAARKAWNEAMRATAGATALPPALQQPNKRRSTRGSSNSNAKSSRRRNAQKSTVGSISDLEYRQAVWVDALEGVDANLDQQQQDQNNNPGSDDDEYDELEELESSMGTNKKRKRAAAPRNKKKKAKAGVLPKRFLPRSLASILMEEHATRRDGAARSFLQAHAKQQSQAMNKKGKMCVSSAPIVAATIKLCPVTGLKARYTDPRTGIPYFNASALEQIRERPPPWLMLSNSVGGSNISYAAAYSEACKSIHQDDNDRVPSEKA